MSKSTLIPKINKELINKVLTQSFSQGDFQTLLPKKGVKSFLLLLPFNLAAKELLCLHNRN